MRRVIFLLLAVVVCPGIPRLSAAGPDFYGLPFGPETPRPLVEAWLRFHEDDLCRGVDAVFVFSEKGMQVWSLVEDGKRYKKFLKQLAPLAGSFRVELFAAKPPREKDEEGVPPSLWENDELRALMRAPLLRSYRERDLDTESDPDTSLSIVPADDILKQRLMIFAEQTLDRSSQMRRYAADLPALTRAAQNPALDPDLRRLARGICMAHSRNLTKLIDKLEKSLSEAIPAAENSPSPGGKDASGLEAFPMDLAAAIAEDAGTVSRQVYTFIYPELYTVELNELRNPKLLESLAALRNLTADYMKGIGRTASD